MEGAGHLKENKALPAYLTHVLMMMSKPLKTSNSFFVVKTSLAPGVATISSCRAKTKSSSSLSSNAVLIPLVADHRGTFIYYLGCHMLSRLSYAI